MLNFNLKGTYKDSTGYDWDYYRDDQLDPNPDPNAFYIIPRPVFVTDAQGNPSLDIMTLQSDGPTNGSGSLRLDVELTVPSDVSAAISKAILGNSTKFPGVSKPSFISLDLKAGSRARFDLAAGGKTQTFFAQASNYGSNVASFLIQMSSDQLKASKAALQNQGGSFDVSYDLTVPARLRGVTAVLSFDSSIAYSYQVTQPTYNSWGDQTSPRQVQQIMKDSAASKVTLTWGTSTPPADLVKTVTDWANNTIATLVSKEIDKVINIEKLQSGSSFKISDVTSFTNTFAENMVVNWKISPTATLPSLTGLGKKIANFEQTVDSRQQQMQVSTNLPFQSDSSKATNVPKVSTSGSGGLTKPALVKSVDITVTYPGLTGPNASHTFTANGSKKFVAPFNAAHGSKWDLTYSVNYVDTSMGLVSGKVKDIETGTYTLKLAQAGIISVEFNAAEAFATEGAVPNKVDVDLVFPNTTHGFPFHQNLSLTPKESIGTITSLQPNPVDGGYSYQLTYGYSTGVTYKAPTLQHQTGFEHNVPAANALHQVNLLVFVPANKAGSNPVLEATVNMWYEEGAKLPPGFSSALPTKASPAQFTLLPNPDSKGSLIARDKFLGLASADRPLVYAATIDAASGETDIAAQVIQNTQPSIMLSPTQRYFTVQMDGASLDWKSNGLLSVEVLITPKVGKSAKALVTGSQRSFTWQKDDNSNKYLTVSIQSGNVVEYDITVNYLALGKATKSSKFNSLKDVIYNIPPSS